MSDEQFIPPEPKSIPIRPLDKGINTQVGASEVPLGGFLDLVDFHVNPKGLRRRGDWKLDGNFSSFSERPPLRDMWVYWSTSGDRRILMVDNWYLYELDYDGSSYSAERRGITYSSTDDGSSISVDGTSVTGSGTSFLDEGIMHGDALYIDGSTEGSKIASVTDNTTLSLETSAGTSSSVSFDAKFTLNTKETFDYDGRLVGGNSYPDYTVIDNKLVWVDSKRPPYTFDGSTTEVLASTLGYTPSCIETFRDRIYIGQIRGDASTFQRQRVRWSEVNPNYDSFPESNYVDLPYSRGAIWRLKTFSNLLVAFLDDAIHIGRPTNSSDNPVFFEQTETGGIGLVGMRALTGWMGRLFFLGQDNVYELTTDGVKPMGDAAIAGVIEPMDREVLRHALMYTDTMHEKVGLLLPDHGTELERGWEIDMRTGAQSRFTLPANLGFVKEEALSFPIELEDLSGNIEDVKGSFGDYTTEMGASRLYFGGSTDGHFGFLDTYGGSTGKDYSEPSDSSKGLAVRGWFVTGDIDLKRPDRRKTWHRMNIKIEHQLTAEDNPIRFKVEGSVDRGQRWKHLGDLIISPGYDEGHVNFRLTGALGRFRITQESAAKPYIITEMVLRVRPRGTEWRYE